MNLYTGLRERCSNVPTKALRVCSSYFKEYVTLSDTQYSLKGSVELSMFLLRAWSAAAARTQFLTCVLSRFTGGTAINQYFFLHTHPGPARNSQAGGVWQRRVVVSSKSNGPESAAVRHASLYSLNLELLFANDDTHTD